MAEEKSKPEPKAAPTFEEQHAADIRARMSAGLTRTQAIECVKAQLENDARIAAEEAAKKKKS